MGSARSNGASALSMSRAALPEQSTTVIWDCGQAADLSSGLTLKL
jgi:hypothetical protein